MPTCDPRLITPVMCKVMELQPRSVLDLGIGMGKWGALSREYLDIWNRRLTSMEWMVAINGVEIYEGYRNPMWDLYTHVTIGNIMDVIINTPPHDLILCLEVLEHLSEENSSNLLRIAQSKCKWMMISYTNGPQDAAFGNIYEQHISRWDEASVGRIVPGAIKLASFWGDMTALFLVPGKLSGVL